MDQYYQEAIFAPHDIEISFSQDPSYAQGPCQHTQTELGMATHEQYMKMSLEIKLLLDKVT